MQQESSGDEQPILVLSRKKPHLLLVLVLSLISGLGLFLGTDTGGVPLWLARVWAGQLLVSGSIAMWAHLTKTDRERGMRIERGALTLQAAAVIAYVMALPVVLGWRIDVVLALPTGAAWAVANLWEVKLISADLGLIGTVRRMGREHRATDQ